MFRWLALGLVGCGTASAPDDSDPPPDSDTDAATGCDFSAFAGTWAGDITQAPQPPWQMAVTLAATAEVEAVIGTVHYTDVNGADPTYDCKTELTCVNRPQMDWETVTERVISDTSGSCADGYAWLRPEADGTLQFEWALTEFGQHLAWANLQRTP